MQVQPLALADPALPDWCALLAEHRRSESGAALSAQALAARVRAEPAGMRRWAARDAGVIVGVA